MHAVCAAIAPVEGLLDVYLKRVDMENFKSFGGKISVPLMEGYMAITGPNGSGKSNITDAIMFVLGPKSPKVVRAGKQTDLIYNGNKSSGRADFMKVTLVFDNTDRMLSWNSDEVRFTRVVKMAGNGEDYYSSFYINDQKSNLAEFDSLLTRARISADGYNLVQQGDVTDITKMGAVERRRVIDRISGIESYDSDIAAAERERAEADANMQSTNIVIGELEEQLKRLEREREVARKHIELKDRLDMANAQLKHRHLANEIEKKNTTLEAIDKANKEIASLREMKVELNRVMEECSEGIAETEKEIEARVGPEYSELKKKIDDVKIKKALADDKISKNEERISEDECDLQEYQEEFAENESQLQSIIQSISESEMELESKRKSLNAARDEEKSISEEMEALGGEHAALDKKLKELESRIDQKSDEGIQIRSKLTGVEAKEDEMSRQISQAETNLSDVEFQIKDAEFNLSEVKKEAGPIVDIDTFRNRILALKQQENELEKQERDINSAMGKLSEEYNNLLIEKRSSEKASRGSEAVSAVLEMRDKGLIKGIHGTVAQLASVDPEFETALSVAAGGKMQHIVVDDDQVAADIISELKRGGHGRATLLPLNKMTEGKPRAKAIMSVKDSLGYAIDLIDFKPEYRSVFWYVFADTIVVDNINTGRRLMGGVRIVTKSGELLEASGAMTGGSIRPNTTLKFGAASQTKLDEVGAKLSSAKASLDNIKSRLADIRNQIREADDGMRNAGAGSIELKGKIAALEAQLKEYRESKKRLIQMVDEKKAAYAEIQSEKSELVSKDKAMSDELDALKAERNKARARIEEIAPTELQRRLSNARKIINEASDAINTVKDILSAQRVEKSGFDSAKERINNDIDRLNEEITKLRQEIEEASKESSEYAVELNALKAMEAEMESGIQELRDKKEDLLVRRSKADSDLSTTTSQIEAKESYISSVEATIIICDQNIEIFRAEIAQIKFEVQQPIPSEETLKRTIRGCENEIEALGKVNMNSIDEYDEKKARYDRLVDEVKKLNDQIDELVALMEDLNSKKKGLFMDVYNGVSENFKTIFAEISGGGEASMTLEDEDDPFKGGLYINAKPRNGKLLKLEALSGGEKSLTALAFIFAIQEHQPSPFYVLDEVDMFLDSVNAEIVAERIQKSSAKTQFIQVSLRNVALKKADHLIGVTRPPNGVSKIIIQPDLLEVSKYEEEAQRKIAEEQAKEGIA